MKHKQFDEPLIVITGALGFIGSGVVRYLNDKGMTNLLLVDDFGSTEKWKNLYGKKYADIIPIHELFTFLEGRQSDIQAFIHLGACSDTTETNGDYLMESNYTFSVRLAEYALTHGHRFIYASSAATYGDGTLGFSDAPDLMDELRPLNLYGYSKHAFDLWLKRRDLINSVVGLKYFNIFGPNEAHKGRMASLVHHMVPKIKTAGSVSLFKSSEPKYKDGDQCRDFFYVKDAVALTCGFLEWDVNGIYNIGRGEPKTWNQLANATFNALGKPVNIEYIPMPADLIGKYQNYTCADMSRLHTALGSRAPRVHTLEEGVTDYVQNYIQTGKTW